MKNNTHSFDIDLAKKVGIEKALILKELCSVEEYKGNNRLDIADGKSWVYYSSDGLSKKFPYMKPSSIRRWMIELEEDGYIESRYLSSDKRDRVKWYHIKSEEDCTAQNEQSSIDQNEQCNIYDTPHTKYTPHSKEIYKEKIIETTRTFYKTEIEQNSGHQHIEGYKQVANFIFLKNPFGKPIVGILSLENQLKFSDYLKILDKNEYNVTGILDMLANMANTPSYTKGKVSLFLTLNNWINREKKKK